MQINDWILCVSQKEISKELLNIFYNHHLKKKFIDLTKQLKSLLEVCCLTSVNLEMVKFVFNDMTNFKEIEIDQEADLFYNFEIINELNYTDKAITFFKECIKEYIFRFFSSFNNVNLEILSTVLSFNDYYSINNVLLNENYDIQNEISKCSSRSLSSSELQYISGIIMILCFNFVEKSYDIKNLCKLNGEKNQEILRAAYPFLVFYDFEEDENHFNLNLTDQLINRLCDCSECGVNFMSNVIYNFIRKITKEESFSDIQNEDLIKTLKNNRILFYTSKKYNFNLVESEKVSMNSIKIPKEYEHNMFINDYEIEENIL